MGERCVRNAEVAGSNPVVSTREDGAVALIKCDSPIFVFACYACVLWTKMLHHTGGNNKIVRFFTQIPQAYPHCAIIHTFLCTSVWCVLTKKGAARNSCVPSFLPCFPGLPGLPCLPHPLPCHCRRSRQRSSAPSDPHNCVPERPEPRGSPCR